jgi:outer membrane lipopolysaccharide assembly protein LptE/RlpB
MSKVSKICLLMGISFALSACGGWHLRGSTDESRVDLSIYIQAAAASTIGVAIRRELKNRGARVAQTRTDADAVISVSGQHYERRILSIDPDSGKVREIELALTAEFSVRGKEGALLIPRETIEWQLDYVFDEGSVLGTNAQDAIGQRDLAELAATAMVLRIQSLKLDATPATAE